MHVRRVRDAELHNTAERTDDAVRIGHLGQIGEERPAREVGAHPSRRLDGQARFPDPARSDQRHESFRLQQRCQRRKLGVATQQTGPARWRRVTRTNESAQWREVTAPDLEEPHRLREVVPPSEPKSTSPEPSTTDRTAALIST